MNTIILISADTVTSLMNKIFDACVKLLVWLAGLTGTTYEEINVIIFVILEPIFILVLIVYIIMLRRRISTQKKLTE
jgi:preprotein translocase subunit SecY